MKFVIQKYAVFQNTLVIITIIVSCLYAINHLFSIANKWSTNFAACLCLIFVLLGIIVTLLRNLINCPLTIRISDDHIIYDTIYAFFIACYAYCYAFFIILTTD